jgi:hypothetical protein
LPGICRVGRRCTFAGYLPGRPGEPINGRPPGHHLHLPPAPAYPAKRAEPFAARLHPPQNQSGGRGSLPLRRPGGPHRAQAGPHRGSTEAHTTSLRSPPSSGPVVPPHPPLALPSQQDSHRLVLWPPEPTPGPSSQHRCRARRPPLSGEPTRQNLARRERFHTPLNTRDEPVHQWEIVIYKSRPRPLTLSRS